MAWCWLFEVKSVAWLRLTSKCAVCDYTVSNRTAYFCRPLVPHILLVLVHHTVKIAFKDSINLKPLRPEHEQEFKPSGRIIEGLVWNETGNLPNAI
jgi:hypothetical protein